MKLSPKIFAWSLCILPLCSATLSAWHVAGFFSAGNPLPIAIAIAALYEIANINIILMEVSTIRVSRWFIHPPFFILTGVGLLANFYDTFDYLHIHYLQSTGSQVLWADSFWLLLTYITGNHQLNADYAHITYSLSGMVLPVISVFLTFAARSVLRSNMKPAGKNGYPVMNSSAIQMDLFKNQ